ncbi:PAS domain S-box protein [Halostella sp. JP-L12]|uniref:PAS domain S-box protein n=1 Tax=Halostella TaxID=1843185 RepID=UPI000EF8419A|nr:MULTISPECIES: PAS domain S-box protein [Halostella]NHN47998.1 PAS domain S-box protein [Halostella sp. JP-L12]
MSDQAGNTQRGFWADATGELALDRYSTIVNMVDDGIYQLDSEGRFVAVNDTIVELTGYSKDELLGEYVSLVLADEDVSRIQHEIHRRLTDDDRRDEPIEFTARTADDDSIPCELELQLLVEDGTFQGSMGVVRDITGRKQEERNLRQERDIVEGIVETSPVGIAVVDADGEVTFANERAEEIYGRSRDELSEFSHDDTRLDLVEENGDPLETGEMPFNRVVTQEEEIHDQILGLRRPSGERVWVSVNGAPQWNEDDELERAVFAFEDVTKQRENERKLEKSEHRYRTLVENFPNGSVGMFDEDMRYTAVGGQLLDSLDIEPEDRIGSTIHELHPDDLVEQIEPYFQSALEGEADTFEIEFGDRYLYAHALPVRDAADEVFAGMLVVRDVTERKEYEREIERNNEQLETLFEVLPVGVVVAEDDGEIVAANDNAHEIWGGDVFDADSVAEYEQYPVRWADSGDRVKPEEMTLARVINGEEVTDPEIFEIEATDGERRVVEAEGMPIRDETGEVDRGVITLSDVTERREAQRQLEESERLYRTLAEHFPNGVVGVYDHDLRYTLAAGEKIGDPAPSAEEVEGTRMPDLYPDDAVADLEPLFRAAIEDGETGSIETEVVGRHWRVWATPLRADDGEIFAGLSFAQDITERKQRERELERTLDLLERTERIADVGGWEINPETQDVFWTDHIFDLLEVPGDEEPPLDEALDMYHEEDKPRVEAAVEEALTSGDPFDIEVRLRTVATGDVRWLRLQGVPETVDGEVVSFRGAAQDITERKQRERRLEELIDRLEESNERLEQFAYAASHDLQEPLRMVSTYLQLIEQRYGEVLDEEGEEFLEFAVDGADRMRNMIEGLLQYSRVETQGDDFASVDLDDVIADVRDDLQVRIEENDAEITADELPVVEGDGGQLRQVFQNLLNNAIEYSGDGPPRVDISAERNDGQWVVSVSDEGIGIDPADADRVFEVFQSLHVDDEHTGTGIGLALCERIVERHGGEIWVDSEPGEGATFSFTLPAASDQKR